MATPAARLAVQTDPGSVPGGRPAERELREALERWLAEMPEPYGLLLNLVELEGATFAEAAAFMGISLQSLRLLHSEGRRRLRAIVLAHSEAGTI